jgi:hypothetical protein
MSSNHITAVTVAERCGISPETARSYLRELEPREAPRLRQKFDASRLDELVSFCQSKRRRKCYNRFNAVLKPNKETRDQ